MKKLIIILSLISTTAQAAQLNGRDYYFEHPETLATINKSIAKEMNLPVLPLPHVNLVENDPLSPFGDVQRDEHGKITVTLTYRAKLYHAYHEMVHYYQFSYNIPGDSTCAEPMELEPMILSSKWCEKNNCPVKSLSELRDIAGCK